MAKLTVSFMLLLVICGSFVLSSSAKHAWRKGEKKKVINTCQAADREGDMCPMIYSPVCGYRPGIACITTPCNHVTYSNACEACHDPLVQSYTAGECTQLD